MTASDDEDVVDHRARKGGPISLKFTLSHLHYGYEVVNRSKIGTLGQCHLAVLCPALPLQ